VYSLTDSKQLDAGVPQAFGGGDHVVLGLPVRDQDADLGDAGSGSRLGLEAVLLDVGQRQPCGRCARMTGRVRDTERQRERERERERESE